MATTTSSTVGVVPPPQHPSSTLVNISEESATRLVSVLSPLTSNPTKFETSCASAISNGNAAKLLTNIISNGAITGLVKDDTFSINEAVSIFSLLTVYLDRVEDDSVATDLCSALADAVGKGGSGDTVKEKQAAMVAALFNLRSNGNEKVKLLAKIIEMSDTAAIVPGEPQGTLPLADVIDPTTLSASLKLWGNVDNVELRSLFGEASKGMDRVLEKLSKDEQEDKTTVIKIKVAREWKQSYMLAFLETYKEESQLDDAATSTARDASVYAISDPINLFSTQRRILSIPAITALSKSDQPGLYDLLKIFMEGKLQDYRDFTSMPDKASVFGTYGLSEQECMKNMCLLSLVSLAGEHEEIPYSAIASTLSIGEDEVEQWVIKAVSSGLMEAKMDQLRKVVLVERCAVRQFGMKEWTALKTRLDTWKVNVKGVLDALEKSGTVVAEN